MQITEMGIRDAKVHLSKILKLVQQGNEVIITDRGRPVGKIVPIEEQNLSVLDRLKKMEEKGLVRELPVSYYRTIPPPIPIENSIAQTFLQQDREK